MDDDHIELIRRLFVAATEILEDATMIAAQGQSADIGPAAASYLAGRLNEVSRHLGSLSDAVIAVTRIEKI